MDKLFFPPGGRIMFDRQRTRLFVDTKDKVYRLAFIASNILSERCKLTKTFSRSVTLSVDRD